MMKHCMLAIFMTLIFASFSVYGKDTLQLQVKTNPQESQSCKDGETCKDNDASQNSIDSNFAQLQKDAETLRSMQSSLIEQTQGKYKELVEKAPPEFRASPWKYIMDLAKKAIRGIQDIADSGALTPSG